MTSLNTINFAVVDDNASAAEARRLLLHHRTAGRHQPLHRRAQRDRGKALYLACRFRRDNRRPKPSFPGALGTRLNIEPRKLGRPAREAVKGDFESQADCLGRYHASSIFRQSGHLSEILRCPRRTSRYYAIRTGVAASDALRLDVARAFLAGVIGVLKLVLNDPVVPLGG